MLKSQKDGEYSNMIKIRAHHLLCVQGFQGYGYSRDFERNMDKVIMDLKSEEQVLEIVAECDVICSHCPHKKDGLCKNTPESHEIIKNMDLNVLKKLGLKEGTRSKAKNVFTLLDRNIKTNDVYELCGDCSWRNKCLLYISKANTQKKFL